MNPGSICALRCASSIPVSCWMEKSLITTISAISWPRRTSLWPIKTIEKRLKAPTPWPTGGSAGAAIVARCRQPRVISTSPCSMSRAATPPRCRRARSMFTTLARPAVSPHSACPSTSAGAATSTTARAIRPAAGFSTRKRSLRPSACSNGHGWRPWRAQRRDAHCRRGREDQPPGRGLAYRDSERPPPDSRIELISANEADWNALQTSLLRLRLKLRRLRLPPTVTKSQWL